MSPASGGDVAPGGASGDQEALAFVDDAWATVRAAVLSYNETGQRGQLAATASYALALMDLRDAVPADVACTMLGWSALWFSSAADAWGRPEWLETAIDLGQDAAALAPPGQERGQYRLNLAHALVNSVEAGADPARLRQVSSLLEDAPATEDPDEAETESTLGNALCMRFIYLGDDTLQAGVEAHRRAVSASDPDAKPGRMNNLGNGLRRLADVTRLTLHLEEALRVYETALELVGPEGEPRATLLNGLSLVLTAWHELTGDDQQLRRAVRVQRECIAATPASSVHLTGRRDNLAGLLVELFEADEQLSDLLEAIGLLETSYERSQGRHAIRAGPAQNLANALHIQAVADGNPEQLRRVAELRDEALALLPAGTPHRAGVVVSLAKTLLRLDELDPVPDPGRVRRAETLLVQAVDEARRVDPATGVEAGRGLLVLRARRGAFAEAAAAGEAALASARRAVLVQRDRGARRTVLAALGELPVRTALACVAASDAGRAVDALEAGRAVLLADRVAASASHEPTSPLAHPGADVRPAAAVRPLLYLAAGEAEGVAILVGRHGTPEPVSCPALTASAGRELAALHWGAVERLRGSEPDVDAADEKLAELSRRLGMVLPGPLIASIAAIDEVTIIASGYLAGLPWQLLPGPDHVSAAAAGRRVGTAPSAAVLRWAAERAPAKVTSVLVAAVLTGPAAPAGARREVDTIGWARPGATTVLLDAAATTDAVVRALAAHDAAHVICHGLADPWNPADSSLQLWDGPLRVAGLSRDEPLRTRLALLSACESGTSELVLPDEASGLATALVEAGVAGVVGASWPVPGDAAALFASRFSEGVGAGRAPLEAYALAMQAMTSTTAEELDAWSDGRLDQSLRGGSGTASGRRAGSLPLHAAAAFAYVGY